MKDSNVQEQKQIEQFQKRYNEQGVKRKITYLGLSYFCIFVSELTFLSLVTQLYDQMDYEYLGNISLFLIYTFFGITSTFSAYFIEKFSIKWIQFFAALVLTIFISVGILVSTCSAQSTVNTFICHKASIYSIVIIVTSIAGATGAIIWTAQSGFMIFYCSLYPEKEGKLIGLFWGIFQLSQGFGSIIAFLLLKYFTQQIFFIFLTGIAGVGVLLLFFYEDIPSTSKLSMPIRKLNISLTSQGSHALSEHTRIKIKEFKKIFTSSQMRPYFSFFFMNGVAVAFYQTYLYKIIERSLGLPSPSQSADPESSSQQQSENEQELNVKTTYVLICLGLSELIAAYVCGRLMDKIDYRKVAYFSNIIVQLAIFFSLAAYFLYSYMLCFVSAFLWGFADCFYISVASYICQIRFNGAHESFCIFRLVQAFGVMVTVLLSIFMAGIDMYYFMFIIFAFIILSSSFMLSSFKHGESTFDLVIQEQLVTSEIVELSMDNQKQQQKQQQPS